MSEYIRLVDGRIAEHICGAAQDGMVAVPDGFSGVVGMDVREFDDGWNVRPLSSRVSEGLVTIDPEYTLDGEDIRPKTLSELIDTGLIEVDAFHVFDGVGMREKTDNELYRDKLKPIPAGFKLVEVAKDKSLDGLVLEEMSLEEKVSDGVISQVTADAIQSLSVRAERNARFKPYDEAIARLNRAKRKAATAAIEEVIALWDAYAEALADIPEQAEFPWVVEWPSPPDKVEI